MLFLLFQLGQDRYALDVTRVVEVLPLVELKRLPQAPPGLAGIFNYHGRPVPAVDLCELTLGRPASSHLSTRIVIVRYPDGAGRPHLMGLIAEHVTRTLRKDVRDVVDPGMRIGPSKQLGPILMDSGGPIRWVHEHGLVPQPVGELLFSEVAATDHEKD